MAEECQRVLARDRRLSGKSSCRLELKKSSVCDMPKVDKTKLTAVVVASYCLRCHVLAVVRPARGHLDLPRHRDVDISRPVSE
jgi:hypothetical protein